MIKLKIGEQVNIDCLSYVERTVICKENDIELYLDFSIPQSLEQIDITEDAIREALNSTNNIIDIIIDNKVYEKNLNPLIYFYYNMVDNVLSFKLS